MSNTTNVVGYYNGNRWPIQLVISKLNITLTLEPGKYVLDRQGRKINDPYFEVFANNKQLHRETSATPVAVIVIPEVTNTVTPAQTSNPVRAITEWKRNERGVREPVLDQPTGGTTPALPAAVVASASESVRPMSMEEARKRGLVRKVREVPEDFGVNDTTGLPPSGIPQMRYSIDPGVNKPAPPLPKEMLQLPKDDPNRQSRSQIVAGLNQGAAATPVTESEHPFANTAVVNNPANSPIMAGTPAAAPLLPEAVDEPPLEEEEVIAETMPVPNVPGAAQPAQPPLRPLTPNNQFTCMACSAPHKFRSQLLNHAKAKHPDRINAIMAPYPA